MTLANKKLLFKQFLVLLLTTLLVLMVFYLFNPLSDSPKISKLRYAGESAGRMMERHLEFYEGYESTSMLERALHSFLFGTRESVQDEAIHVYREVLKYYSQNPGESTPWSLLNTRTRLLVTIAELKSRETLLKELASFDASPEEEVIAVAVRFAYIDSEPDDFNPEIFTGANLLPVGWAADHLRMKIAEKRHNQRMHDFLQQRTLAQGQRLRERVSHMVISIALILCTGIILIIRYKIFFSVPALNKPLLDKPWHFTDGLLISSLSALLGLLITLVLHALSPQYFKPGIWILWSGLFASLPMLALIYYFLLKPRKTNFRQAFGLSLFEFGVKRFFATTGALLSLEWIGLLLIGWGTWKFGIGSHWSEGIQERMIFGPTETVILSTINFVLWAAIFEEIGFRGLFYTSLRARLTPTLAIVISALVFSSLHLYSLPGFLSVFWSGLVLAYSYERYRSLLPGITIHAADNMLSLSTILLFYR